MNSPTRSLLALSLVALAFASCEAPKSRGGPSATNSSVDLADSEESPIAEQVAIANAQIDAIVAIPADEHTFENTVEAIDDTIAEFFEGTRMIGFLSNVSTDADEREIGRRASADASDWFSLLNKRKDLFEAVLAVWNSGDAFDDEERRLIETMLRDFRREGMDLDDDDAARLKALDTQLNELGIEFRQNIAEDATKLYLTDDELAGCDEDWKSSLPRAAELYVVDLSGPNRRQIGTYCDVAPTRLKLVTAVGHRAAPENIGILETLLALRLEKARLLGFETTAAYETDAQMAKTPEAVLAFYDDLRPRLRKKAETDFAEFQAAKREHTGNPEATLDAWDVSYYRNWLLREKYSVDSAEIVKYFPIESVTRGLFEIAEKLYGVRFEDITESATDDGRPMWHEDVRLYAVFDDTTGELLGEIYTDLYPRENKVGHAAVFPLALRKEWSDGDVTYPRAALVCNFTKPTAGKPSLLAHSEVVTYFHEFGHALHNVFSKVRFASLSGTSVARDFVEAPSQMFENWAWNAATLGTFARRYDTGESLPDDLLARMVAAKNLGSGLDTEGQVYLGRLDFAYHTQTTADVDTDEIRKNVYEETRLFPSLEGDRFQASFDHLVGYQAGYYGYLWSLVYAADMFRRFGNDLMNPVTGRAYRDLILAKGSSREEFDMVRDFLGREPNPAAFLAELGLED